MYLCSITGLITWPWPTRNVLNVNKFIFEE